MLEAVDQVAQEREPAVRLFLLLVRGLRALDAAPADPGLVLDAFLLKLMAVEGYQPSIAECAGCGALGPHVRFSVARGGSLCPDCRSGGEALLDEATLPLLEALLSGELASMPAATGGPRREVARLIQAFVEYHLDRRLRSYPLVAR
jgi:DNA repair protein RecO (recombination protein O)